MRKWELLILMAVALQCAPDTSVEAQGRSSLRILPPNSSGWFRLETPGKQGRRYTLQASPDLLKWSSIAVAHEALYPFPDPGSANWSTRFYRLMSEPLTAAHDWKNQILFPHENFLSPWTGYSADEVRWIKFAILANDPTRVFYQDSSQYQFHYDFATKRLEPFVGMSRAAFDQISLRTNGQKVVLGAVLFPPIGNVSEYGIQFVGLDPYPKETVASLFEIVRSTIVAEPSVKAFYIPSFEQARATKSERPYYESRGIAVSTADRWIRGNQTYAVGWALGRLKFVPASEISTAFVTGLLLPQDILLTDGVPAEIPVLAGVISLAPSTPNSHGAILSRSFGIPFVYLAEPATRALAQKLTGQEVVLRAGNPETGGAVNVIPLDAAIDPAVKSELLALKTPPAVQIPRKARLGAFSASTENLLPADIKYFGGKAANFGLLRQSIPSNSPVAMAFSLDLWDGFLDQTLPNGKTLRSEIKERLAGHTNPPNMSALAATLAGVRKLITDTARFPAALQSAVTNALRGFDAGRNIRFRSSTNVEDSEQFTGAGLYDSFSGCLADELDGDSSGPSHCDPTESKERGVFRAIQKVYASFYNDNAYLERLRHRVSEDDAGMGLLVHHSFPDEIEMANGVATLRRGATVFATNLTAELVSQLGAVSVSNPDTSARPEVMAVSRLGNRTYLDPKDRSSLVPLGGYVLDWEKDYLDLMNLLSAAADRFRRYYPEKKDFTLDFEYKKERPGVLSVKQIRELPLTESAPDAIPFLLNQTNAFEVFQGEFGDVFANHRLKAELNLQTRNLRLHDANLAQSVYTHARIRYVDGSRTPVLEGMLPLFENALYSRKENLLTDQWFLNAPTNPRRYTLTTEIQRRPSAPEKIILTLGDFALKLSVDYTTPLPILGADGQPATATGHTVMLRPVFPPDTPGIPVQRSIRASNGLEIQTRFYWRQPPSRGIGFKTADLLRWEETSIHGLTSSPIVLRGYYSQTYRPGHHNFWEEFIFEPRLDENHSPQTAAELEAQNIQFLYAYWGEGSATVQALGLDGKFRSLGSPGGGSKP